MQYAVVGTRSAPKYCAISTIYRQINGLTQFIKRKFRSCPSLEALDKLFMKYILHLFMPISVPHKILLR